MADLFGIVDAVKRLTPPPGLEGVHQDGFSWARQGVDAATSTKLTADDWNRIIAQLRGVAIATPGFDPAGRDPGDPMLLRDAITSFAVAKIIQLLPDTVLENTDGIAEALAGVTAFVNACVAAVPTNAYNSSNQNAGTLPDARLAAWLKPTTTAIDASVDLDDITNQGWHDKLVGTTNPDLPAAGFYHIFVIAHSTLRTQFAFPYGFSPNTYGLWMRGRNSGGVWTAWNRILDRTFADTLYVPVARTISATGLATGGGSLAANRTIDVAKSSNAQAIAGTDDATAMTPVTTKASVEAFMRSAPDAILEDQKASGTNGGGSTATTWVTRALNTEVHDPLGLVSLASNQFTVLADGWVRWSCPAFVSLNHRSRLYNVTDSAVAGNGTSEWNANTTQAQTRSFGGCAVTAGKTYRVEHFITNARAADGLGVNTGTGAVEVYTQVEYVRRRS